MSISKDYGDIVKILVNDSTIKNLMLIPVQDQTDYGLLANKYFLQQYKAEIFTDEDVCRIMVRDKMQYYTNNEFVKWAGVVFEVYVPVTKDLMDGFETRILKICDRLVQLFNRQLVNYNRMSFQDCYQTVATTLNYKRYNVTFNYKKIYR